MARRCINGLMYDTDLAEKLFTVEWNGKISYYITKKGRFFKCVHYKFDDDILYLCESDEVYDHIIDSLDAQPEKFKHLAERFNLTIEDA